MKSAFYSVLAHPPVNTIPFRSIRGSLAKVVKECVVVVIVGGDAIVIIIKATNANGNDMKIGFSTFIPLQ